MSAIYRIKHDSNDDLPAALADEQWRQIDPDLADELDYDEFALLNQKAEEGAADEDDLDIDRPLKPSWVKILLVLLALVVFILWTGASLIGDDFDWKVLRESSRLSQDEALAELEKAVVVVEGSGGSGSGFNIWPDGLVITNRHVVEDSGIITIRFNDSQVFTTSEWVDIPGVDLALLKLSGSDLPFVDVSGTLPQEGERVIIIGNPRGYDWTISEGYVFAVAYMEDTPVICLDAPIYPGSSGSPVFDESLQVTGIVFARSSQEDNKGYAIPVYYLTSFLEEVYEH